MIRSLILAAIVAAVIPAMTTSSAKAEPERFLIALSWQPAFCETHRTKAECANPASDAWEATRFALHGLWPQPQNLSYCGVTPEAVAADKAGAWNRLPDVAGEVDRETRAEMRIYMPGSASGLERHEWIKHGTCAGMSADAYFDLAFSMVKRMAGTSTGRLIAARVGQSIPAAELCRALEADFGPAIRSAAQLRTVRLRGRTSLSEVWIDLATDRDGRLAQDPDGRLTLDAAHLARAEKPLKCKGVLYIDPTGYTR